MTRRDDEAAIRACLEQVTGYDVTEAKLEYKANEAGELELVKKTEIVKHIPGDFKAAEFWLTNRQPKLWKSIRQHQEDNADREEIGVVILPPVEEEAGDG